MKRIITAGILLALSTTGCTLAGTELAGNAEPESRPSTASSTVDTYDEYDTDYLRESYEIVVETLMPELIRTSFGEFECQMFEVAEADFWAGFFDPAIGFYAELPDEAQYVITEAEVKADVRPIITDWCGL